MGTITNEVVAFRAVTATAADQTMVAIDIHDIVALRTKVLGLEDLHTQPSLEHITNELRIGILSGSRVEPTTSVWGRHKAEVGLESQGS